jgi:predicted GNAT family acetyltransferase
MGGESTVMQQALAHPVLVKQISAIRECLHLELAPRKIPHSSGGHHRFAQTSDIPRLDQYLSEFAAELDEIPPHDWRTMIAENRILLSIQEGTVTSVAQRGPSTLDRMQIEGVFTFKPFRRRGLARNLVTALTRQAAGRGQDTSAIVGKDNKPMLSLLDALQFNKTTSYLIATFEQEKDNGEETGQET